MKESGNVKETSVRDQLSTKTRPGTRAAGPLDARGTDREPTLDDVRGEAAFWRAQFEKERERLAKLWVAYKDVEAELELRKDELETREQPAPAKAAAGPVATAKSPGAGEPAGPKS